MSVASKIPPLRFKGFEGAWEAKRLERLVKKRNESAESGDVPKLEYEDVVSFEGVLKRSLDQLYVVKRGTSFYIGDVLYGKLRPYLGNWFLAPFNGVAAGDWWVLKPDGIDSECLYALIQTEAFQVAANQSTGSKMPRADWNLVSETLYSIPLTIGEQQKIGSTFRSIDALIADRESAVEKLQTLKKAMLEKMFPCAGAKVPEARFTGFDVEWKKKRLGDVLKIGNGKDYKHLEPGNVPVYGTGGYMASVAVALAHGPSVCIGRKGTIDNPQYLEGAFWTVDTLFYTYGYNEIDAYWLYCQFKRIPWRMYNEASGVPSLSKMIIEEVEILVPSLPEQRKIGAYFRSLDALISARQEEVGKLKDLKKALLVRMFV